MALSACSISDGLPKCALQCTTCVPRRRSCRLVNNNPPQLNLPAHHYVTQDSFALERERVFWRTWQVVGATSSVADPGQYLAVDLAGAGVVVVRDQQGVLRAFRNVCRHRGSPLVECGLGNAAKLRCPYHNWVYELDGSLLNAPDFGDEGAINLADWRRTE